MTQAEFLKDLLDEYTEVTIEWSINPTPANETAFLEVSELIYKAIECPEKLTVKTSDS